MCPIVHSPPEIAAAWQMRLSRSGLLEFEHVRTRLDKIQLILRHFDRLHGKF
jgi:hypothetical protein